MPKNILSEAFEEVIRRSFMYHKSCVEKVFAEKLFNLENIIYKNYEGKL